jgi:predicted XRE-type DNA-binding protein
MKTEDLLDSENNEMENSEKAEIEKPVNEILQNEQNEPISETPVEKTTSFIQEEQPEIVDNAEIEHTVSDHLKEETVLTEQVTISETETMEEEILGNKEILAETTEVTRSEQSTLADFDYASLSMEDLVDQLKYLTDLPDLQKHKDKIELIKVNFYKKHHAAIEAQKKEFLDAGHFIEDFEPSANPVEEQFKAYYSVYKEKKAELNVNSEEAKQKNLAQKYLIIEKIQQLAQGSESLNRTYHEFRELQKQWQEIGLVPQSEVNKLWEHYNYQVEIFYDFLKLNKDLRDLDLRKNLELKLDLCARAEELLLEPKVISSFKDLQKLHTTWREIGPVPADKKDELWERFKQATAKINKKHQDYFEDLKKEQANNLKAKTLLCDKVDELLAAPHNSPKDWEDSSAEIIELQRLWKLIGFAPKKENNKIYSRFRKSCDNFFDAKRQFYSKNKEEEDVNLQLKTELCLQAESMMDSTEWKKTTDLYIELQKKWKTIGQVPRKHKDDIWNRFRKACNTFFDKKSAHFSSRDESQDKNLALKLELIEKVKNFQYSDDNQADYKILNELQKAWTDIGHVPLKNKDMVQQEFRMAVNQVFEKLELNEGDMNKVKFKSKIESLKGGPKSMNRIRMERDKLISRIDKVKGNIVLWENNIGFFAKSKNADTMISDFKIKIEKAKESVKALEEQLYMLDDLV